MTPLHWAIEKSYDNIAELLLENGANPHIMSKFLKTPYLLAKEKNNDFIVNLIEMLPSTPLSASSHYDSSSVFVKTPTTTSTSSSKVNKEEVPSLTDVMPQKTSHKRERFHSYDSADIKRLKATQNDAKELTLQFLKEQMSMMTSAAEDTLIQSALQSGRKIMLTEAGKKLLNDSSLNKFLKIPLHTTISSAPSTSISSKSPVSTTTTSRRSVSGDNSDVLEIFRETKQQPQQKTNNNNSTADILNIIRTTSDLQEVTITQRSSKLSPISPIQKNNSGVSLSAINVPKAKAQNLTKTKLLLNQLPSTDIVNSDFRSKSTTNNNNSNINNNNNSSCNNNINNSSFTDDDFSKPETIKRKYSELLNSHQQLRRSFEREQQKNDALQRQFTILQSNFESYKRQQQLKIDSILQVLLQNNTATGVGDRNIFKYSFNHLSNTTDKNNDNDDAEEVL